MAKAKAKQGFCVFVNKDWTAMKMITPQNFLLHYKATDRRRPINMDTIKYLPSCVQGGELNYNKALESAVTEQMAKWERRRKN
jgi:hypothetical protein